MVKRQSIETQINLLSNLIELAKFLANQIMEDEIKREAGLRYEREKPLSCKYSRWGSNIGSIRVGKEKVKIRVSRIRDNESLITERPDVYRKLRSIEFISEVLMRRILLGLSQSSIRKAFIEELAETLKSSLIILLFKHIKKSNRLDIWWIFFSAAMPMA